MDVALGQSPTIDFTTHNPVTGMVSDADVLPTCEVFEDTTDVALAAPTVVKRTGKTGNYRVTFAATAANGFEVDKAYNVVVQATVGGVTAKSRIATFIIPTSVVAGGGFSL